MKKVLFIDRDGTLIKEPKSDFQVDKIEKFELFPNAISALKKIRSLTDYELVMVTNQDGLGTDSFPEETFWPFQNLLISILQSENIVFDAIKIDPSLPEENSPNRKPGTGMLKEYMDGSYDLKNSFVIGDRESDLILAKNLGCKSIFISEKENELATLTTLDWEEIVNSVLFGQRNTKVSRKTNETEILLDWNLDGNGKVEIETGIGFLDHMLEQIAKHSNSNLKINCKGDLEVDEHHTVEDVAIVLGTALRKMLGDKKGINRYAFLLPMDESLAQIAMDLSGRAELVWNVSFQREYIGNIPTEMFKHFFKSLALEAKITLNIACEGENEHHKIESIFKGFAKVLGQASSRSLNNNLMPSTKGVI